MDSSNTNFGSKSNDTSSKPRSATISPSSTTPAPPVPAKRSASTLERQRILLQEQQKSPSNNTSSIDLVVPILLIEGETPTQVVEQKNNEQHAPTQAVVSSATMNTPELLQTPKAPPRVYRKRKTVGPNSKSVFRKQVENDPEKKQLEQDTIVDESIGTDAEIITRRVKQKGAVSLIQRKTLSNEDLGRTIQDEDDYIEEYDDEDQMTEHDAEDTEEDLMDQSFDETDVAPIIKLAIADVKKREKEMEAAEEAQYANSKMNKSSNVAKRETNDAENSATSSEEEMDFFQFLKKAEEQSTNKDNLMLGGNATFAMNSQDKMSQSKVKKVFGSNLDLTTVNNNAMGGYKKISPRVENNTTSNSKKSISLHQSKKETKPAKTEQEVNSILSLRRQLFEKRVKARKAHEKQVQHNHASLLNSSFRHRRYSSVVLMETQHLTLKVSVNVVDRSCFSRLYDLQGDVSIHVRILVPDHDAKKSSPQSKVHVGKSGFTNWFEILRTEPKMISLSRQDPVLLQFEKPCNVPFTFERLDYYKFQVIVESKQLEQQDSQEIIFDEVEEALGTIVASNSVTKLPTSVYQHQMKEHLSLVIEMEHKPPKSNPSSPNNSPNSSLSKLRLKTDTYLDLIVSAKLTKKRTDLILTVSQETHDFGTFSVIYSSPVVAAYHLSKKKPTQKKSTKEPKWDRISIKPQKEVIDGDRKLKFDIWYWDSDFKYKVPIGSYECFYEALTLLEGQIVPILTSSDDPTADLVGQLCFNKVTVRHEELTKPNSYDVHLVDYMKKGLKFQSVAFAVDFSCLNKRAPNSSYSLHSFDLDLNLYSVIMKSIAERIEQYKQNTEYHLLCYGGYLPFDVENIEQFTSHKGFDIKPCASLLRTEPSFSILQKLSYDTKSTSNEDVLHGVKSQIINNPTCMKQEKGHSSITSPRNEEGDSKIFDKFGYPVYSVDQLISAYSKACYSVVPFKMSDIYKSHNYSFYEEICNAKLKQVAKTYDSSSLSSKDKTITMFESRYAPSDFYHVVHDYMQYLNILHPNTTNVESPVSTTSPTSGTITTTSPTGTAKKSPRSVSSKNQQITSPISQNTAAVVAPGSSSDHNELNYNLLFVLTPNDSINLKETLIKLTESANYPLSVFIIGVGSNCSFKTLKTINMDDKITVSEREIQYRIRNEVRKCWNVEYNGIRAIRSNCDFKLYSFPKELKQLYGKLDIVSAKTRPSLPHSSSNDTQPRSSHDSSSGGVSATNPQLQEMQYFVPHATSPFHETSASHTPRELQEAAESIAEEILKLIPKHTVQYFLNLRNIKV